MNALRRLWLWLRGLSGGRAEEAPRDRLARALLARQMAERRSIEARAHWVAARRTLAEAEASGDADALERARYDERAARDAYEAVHTDERAARDDVEAARAALPPEPAAAVVTEAELEAAAESRFLGRRERAQRQQTLAVLRALDREGRGDLAAALRLTPDLTEPEVADAPRRADRIAV